MNGSVLVLFVFEIEEIVIFSGLNIPYTFGIHLEPPFLVDSSLVVVRNGLIIMLFIDSSMEYLKDILLIFVISSFSDLRLYIESKATNLRVKVTD